MALLDKIVFQPARSGWRRHAYNAACVAACVGAASLAGFIPDRFGMGGTSIVIVYVLFVQLAALLTASRAAGFAASALSVFLFNYLFTEPQLSLAAWGVEYPWAFAVMFAVALVSGWTAVELRYEAELMRERNVALKKSEKAADQVRNEQVRVSILRSISHDLRTPLTAIVGNADMLLDEGAGLDEAERRRLLQDIRSDAAWLTSTVQNVLTVTRLTDGQVEPQKTVELVDDLFEEALRRSAPVLEGHDVRVSTPDEPLLVEVDPQLMVQLLTNLLANAAEHTQAGSSIELAARREGAHVVCAVADDGPGIPEEDRAHAFDAFWTKRTGAEAQGSCRGTGIGLSVCKAVAQAHGASIEIKDADPHGCIVELTLGAVADDGREASDGACG